MFSDKVSIQILGIHKAKGRECDNPNTRSKALI